MGTSGNIVLNISQPPVNDNFTASTVISGFPIGVTGSNVGATAQANEPSNDGRTVWFSWTAPTTALVSIDTSGSNFDTILSVYTGNAVNTLSLIASNDDANATIDLTSEVSFAAISGTVYRISVDGFSGDVGNIVLNISQLSLT